MQVSKLEIRTAIVRLPKGPEREARLAAAGALA